MSIQALHTAFQSWGEATQAGAKVLRIALTLPFDVAREQYARTVSAGLLPRSMVTARTVSKDLDSWEKWALGPFARQR